MDNTKATASFATLNLDSRTLANEGIDVDIMHPVTGVPTGFYITVLGRDSDVYQKLEAKQQQQRLARMARLGKLPPRTNEEMKESALELIAACTKGWGMRPDEDGNPRTFEPAFNPDEALHMYRTTPEIREQVEAAIVDRARFIKA